MGCGFGPIAADCHSRPITGVVSTGVETSEITARPIAGFEAANACIAIGRGM
jgi:hypothetical protein